MATTTTTGVPPAPLLRAIENMARFHRDHEKFYASAPREQAVALQRHVRTLQALADRWSTTAPMAPGAANRFEGAEDLNDGAALQLDGVLFMEGEGEPAEIGHLKRTLRDLAEQSENTGQWLAAAMESSWKAAAALITAPQLADLLGERHRIIANDWQAAQMSMVVGSILRRAADILDQVDFAPAAVRADLAAASTTPAMLYSAAELMAHGADLLSDSAGLVHGNERRWRTFHTRVAQLTMSPSGPGPARDQPSPP